MPQPLTASQKKALLIFDEHGPMTPKDFAKLMWPDSCGWRRSHKVGYGSSRGAGMALAAGGYLGRLRKKGLVEYSLRHPLWTGYEISDKGREALAALEKEKEELG